MSDKRAETLWGLGLILALVLLLLGMPADGQAPLKPGTGFNPFTGHPEVAREEGTP